MDHQWDNGPDVEEALDKWFSFINDEPEEMTSEDYVTNISNINEDLDLNNSSSYSNEPLYQNLNRHGYSNNNSAIIATSYGVDSDSEVLSDTERINNFEEEPSSAEYSRTNCNVFVPSRNVDRLIDPEVDFDGYSKKDPSLLWSLPKPLHNVRASRAPSAGLDDSARSNDGAEGACVHTTHGQEGNYSLCNNNDTNIPDSHQQSHYYPVYSIPSGTKYCYRSGQSSEIKDGSNFDRSTEKDISSPSFPNSNINNDNLVTNSVFTEPMCINLNDFVDNKCSKKMSSARSPISNKTKNSVSTVTIKISPDLDDPVLYSVNKENNHESKSLSSDQIIITPHLTSAEEQHSACYPFVTDPVPNDVLCDASEDSYLSKYSTNNLLNTSTSNTLNVANIKDQSLDRTENTQFRISINDEAIETKNNISDLELSFYKYENNIVPNEFTQDEYVPEELLDAYSESIKRKHSVIDCQNESTERALKRFNLQFPTTEDMLKSEKDYYTKLESGSDAAEENIVPERSAGHKNSDDQSDETSDSVINECFNFIENYSKDSDPPSWVCVGDVTTSGSLNNLADAVNPELLTSLNDQQLDENIQGSDAIPSHKENNIKNTVFDKCESITELKFSKSADPTSDFYSDDNDISESNGNKEEEQSEARLSPTICSPEPSSEETGLVGAVSRVVRRSMRRMKRLRLSGRKSSNKTANNTATYNPDVSEETDERREVPETPNLGLSSVRSPAATAVLLPSLLAAFNPGSTEILDFVSSPREVLSPPDENSVRESITDSRSLGSSPRRPSEVQPTEDRHINTRLFTENRSSTTSPTRTINSSDRTSDSLVRSAETPEHLIAPSNPTPQPASITLREGNEDSFNNLVNSVSDWSRDTSSSISSPHVNTNPSGQTSPEPPTLPIDNSSTVPSYANSPPDVASQRLRNSRTSYELAQRFANESSDVPSNSGPGRGSNQRNNDESRNGRPGRNIPPSLQGHGVTVSRGTGTPSRRTQQRDNNAAQRRQERRRSEVSSTQNRVQTRNGNRRNATQQRSSANPTRSQGSSQPLSTPAIQQTDSDTFWRRNHSGLMASLAVTVTMFNISRFAVFGGLYGWPFIVQWLIMSLVLGIPLLAFYMSLGQYLQAGIINMWAISPIFKGVGFSMLLAQALVGVYCSVPIAWMFTYFRDSFVTTHGYFRWADCRLVNCTSQTSYGNLSSVISQTIPEYFNFYVLRRDESLGGVTGLGQLAFDQGFNIVLVWLITFLGICRGNRAYGFICYVVFLIAFACYLVVSVYLIIWTAEDIYNSQSINYRRFFSYNRSWMVAAREAFLVWGIHGAVLQQMAAFNKKKHKLHIDVFLISIVTSVALTIAATIGSSCITQLHKRGIFYKSSSFETTKSGQFLVAEYPIETYYKLTVDYFHRENMPLFLTTTIYSDFDNFYTGIRIRTMDFVKEESNNDKRSGYMALRLATELFPALLAVNTSEKVSPFWSALFYFALLLFGFAQQLAVWRCLVEAVIQIKPSILRAWENLLTFCCCLVGCCLSLPLGTSGGINVLYFLDYILGCAWWLMILHLLQVFAVIFIRGKPYGARDIIPSLMGSNRKLISIWLMPMASVAWSMLVPITLLVLSISSFKAGEYREAFAWGKTSYWELWSSQLSCTLQLFPILIVIIVAFGQTIGYLSARHIPLFERIQLLYRGAVRPNSRSSNNGISTISGTVADDAQLPTSGDESNGSSSPLPYSDPPPKYTPPPSYSTATSRRIAKAFNEGLRVSIRRLRKSFRSTSQPSTDVSNTQLENGSADNNPIYLNIIRDNNQTVDADSPPPEYSTIDPRRPTTSVRNKNRGDNSQVEFFYRRGDELSQLRRSITRTLRSGRRTNNEDRARTLQAETSIESQTSPESSSMAGLTSTESIHINLTGSSSNASNSTYANTVGISQSEA